MFCFSQDIAAAIDEEDVGKFTDTVKEFDSMTPLVSTKSCKWDDFLVGI